MSQPRRPGTEDLRRWVERPLTRFVQLEGFDRAMALAGQAFATLLPLLIVTTAISRGGGHQLGDQIIETFDLKGSAAGSVRDAVRRPAGGGVSVLGTAVVVISALSFTRALQRLYERAWRLPSLGLRGNVKGLQWLFVFSLYLALHPIVVPALPSPFGVIVSETVGAALWIVTPYLLLARRVGPRELLPMALLTAVGLNLLVTASAIYMPRAVSSSATQFGVIGVAFSLLSWLFLAGLVLVVAAAVGARPRNDDEWTSLGAAVRFGRAGGASRTEDRGSRT